MAAVESSQAVTDTSRDCLARPLAFIAKPPGAAAEPGGAAELVDECLPFVIELGGSTVISAVERSVDLAVQLGEAVAVASLRVLVEDGVGTEAPGDLRRRPVGIEEYEGRHVIPGLPEQGV